LTAGSIRQTIAGLEPIAGTGVLVGWEPLLFGGLLEFHSSMTRDRREA
jgi:hypothetical protein